MLFELYDIMQVFLFTGYIFKRNLGGASLVCVEERSLKGKQFFFFPESEESDEDCRCLTIN